MSASSFHARLRAGGTVHRADLRLDAGRLSGTLDGAAASADARAAGRNEVVVTVGGRRHLAVVLRRGTGWLVSLGGRAVEVARVDGAADDAGPSAEGEPFATSPMTGVVGKVFVAAGAAAAKGAPLFAVEAMKMEYVVRADRDVHVEEVRAKAGDRVEVGAVVVTFRIAKPGAKA